MADERVSPRFSVAQCKTVGGGTFDKLEQAARKKLVHKYKKTVRENCKKAVFGSIVGDTMQDGSALDLDAFARQFVGGTGCDWCVVECADSLAQHGA